MAIPLIDMDIPCTNAMSHFSTQYLSTTQQINNTYNDIDVYRIELPGKAQ